MAILPFEHAVVELENKIKELRHLSNDTKIDILQEIRKLESKQAKLMHQIYSNLTPWQKVQVARHTERPKLASYIQGLIIDFVPLKGDRCFGEDAALTVGLGTFRGQSVMIMGHEKGHDTNSRVHHNFGMPKPEGYRKATRAMKLADRFGIPIVSFIDTAGAHPGLEAEERGQAEAIATSIQTMLQVSVPTFSIVTGEGGSGGAIALGIGNYIMMLEHAVYSVISPEGCASILWRTSDKREEAAAAQKLTAQDLLSMNIIHEIIPEPLGGAHRSPQSAISAVGDGLERAMNTVLKQNHFKERRHEQFLKMGTTL